MPSATSTAVARAGLHHISGMFMGDQIAVSGSLVEAESRASRYFWPFLVILAVLAVFIAADLSDGTLFLGDVDDRLRAIQISQFFFGKGWYDLSISGIAMPEAYVSPWSRLVDLPYVVIASVLQHVMSPNAALQAAYHIWPPVLLLAFCWFSTVVMVRLLSAGARPATAHFVAAALAMIYAALEFDPGRIDHHNMQLVMLSAALAGTVLWSPAGGLLIAAAVAFSVTVGLETLPLIAVLWAGLGLAWIAGAPGSRGVYRAFSIAIAILAPLVTLVFSGPQVLFGFHADIFSAPYAAAFTGFGVISAIAVVLVRERAAWWTRFAGLALPGLVLLAVIVALAPDLLAGPYKIIDPISRRLWLDHISQEHSILYMVRGGMATLLVTTALQAAAAVFIGILVVREARQGRAAPAIIFAVALASLLATLDALRFVRFPAATLPLFVPLLLTVFSNSKPASQKRYAVLFAACALAFGAVFYGVSRLMPVEREPGSLEAADFLMYDACTERDYAALAGMPAGRYMVPSGMALSVLENDPPSMAVSNISYHRSSPGMRRMFEAFYLTDAKARESAMAPFGYLAFCDYPAPVLKMFEAPNGSLMEALVAGQAWPGLVPVAVSGADRLKVYRVDHAAFR